MRGFKEMRVPCWRPSRVCPAGGHHVCALLEAVSGAQMGDRSLLWPALEGDYSLRLRSPRSLVLWGLVS